jgi:hypothetical protein
MQDKFSDDTQKIPGLLSQFKAVPSKRFYAKMDRSPWNRTLSFTGMALRVSAAAVMILFLVFLIPNASLFTTPPHTPTSTQFAFATETQEGISASTLTLNTTSQPSATPNP